MKSSEPVSFCGLDCHLRRMDGVSSPVPQVHIDDEHIARDDEYVKKLTPDLYTPLISQQYRILKILPGDSHSVLKCRLLRATLTPADGARLDEEIEQDSLVDYDALSYCWGNPARTCSIDCNGIQVPITPHLKSALCELRRQGQARYVWTDALCINQLDDIAEKGEQVQLMFTIFRKARKVIGWLGRSNNACEYENLFRYLHSNSARCFSTYAELHGLDQSHSQANDPVCDCMLTSLKWYSLRLVQQNPWFRRTWIRQEIFAAKKVEMKYGPYSFDLVILIQLIGLVDDTHSRPDLCLFHELVRRHSVDTRTFQNSPANDTIEGRVEVWLDAVLSNAQGFKATKEQDLVFALQNIAQPVDSRSQLLFPVINYRMPSPELFEEFVKRLVSLDYSHDLAPINIFEDRRDFQSNGLPSWVPDWRKAKTRLMKSGLSCYQPHGYKIDISRPGVLSMHGAILGTVSDEWLMHDYQNSLSVSLTNNTTRAFVLASHKVYRYCKSSLSAYRPFNDMPMIGHGFEEIAYRPFRYTIEGNVILDDRRQPYLLASIVVQPGDLLVSFSWETTLLTIHGYERTTWCSVLRRCPNKLDKYYFLGPCVFDHLGWQQPDITDFRATPMSIQSYDLI